MLIVVLPVLVTILTGYLAKGRVFARTVDVSGFAIVKYQQNLSDSEKSWSLRERNASQSPLSERVGLLAG